MAVNDRLDKLTQAMRRAELDAIAVVPGPNLFYLTGMHLHIGKRLTVVFLPAQGEPALVIPALEVSGARQNARLPLRFYPWDDSEGPEAAIRRCADDLGLAGGRIGVEYTTMRVFELRGIETAAPGARIEDATTLLAGLRMVKDAAELAAMREAVRIVEGALRAAIAQIRVGMTERELAGLWEQGIHVAGARTSFETIVASGPNGANPHHANSDRAFQPGDLVVMDGGALYEGYASDITRTIAIGEPSPEARRIYELVLAANAAGRAAVRPGVTGEEIDRAARSVIAAGGYGPQFLHRTGHGLGLEIHEPPYIVAGSRDPLPAGATFTIEPGVYVEGTVGVRIEDNVVITPTGAETLTSFERDLIVV